jgi:hypothetical protein
LETPLSWFLAAGAAIPVHLRICLLTSVTTQRFVLAEMIKASHMDVGILVEFIKHHEIQPDWLSMQLPGGRCFWLTA